TWALGQRPVRAARTPEVSSSYGRRGTGVQSNLSMRAKGIASKSDQKIDRVTERKERDLSGFERIIGGFLRAGRARVLAASGAAIALIAFSDWRVGNRMSLGLLYILPMMVAAT